MPPFDTISVTRSKGEAARIAAAFGGDGVTGGRGDESVGIESNASSSGDLVLREPLWSVDDDGDADNLACVIDAADDEPESDEEDAARCRSAPMFVRPARLSGT
jgi:hypothetical protein